MSCDFVNFSVSTSAEDRLLVLDSAFCKEIVEEKILKEKVCYQMSTLLSLYQAKSQNITRCVGYGKQAIISNPSNVTSYIY